MNNLYVTRTAVHEMLRRAWEMAGAPDSAAVQYRRVLAAWRAADREFLARRTGVRARLAALEAASR